jgi:hypothetical protein
MNEDQKFIFGKIKKGFESEQINEPLTDSDIKRLKSEGDIYKELPENEWNEWSRKVHWALQVAFLNENNHIKNSEKIQEWRNKCVTVFLDGFEKPVGKTIVIDSAAAHFVKNDLFRYITEEFGYDDLTDEEKRIADKYNIRLKIGSRKGGCIVFIALLIVIVAIIWIILWLI